MSEEENKDVPVIPSEETKKLKVSTKAEKAESEVQPKAEQESEHIEKEQKPEKKEESAADLLGANIEQVKIRKAKGSKNITSGICYVVATFNNTKVSFTDMKGNVISWSSSGKCNFRGSRKSTA